MQKFLKKDFRRMRSDAAGAIEISSRYHHLIAANHHLMTSYYHLMTTYHHLMTSYHHLMMSYYHWMTVMQVQWRIASSARTRRYSKRSAMRTASFRRREHLKELLLLCGGCGGGGHISLLHMPCDLGYISGIYRAYLDCISGTSRLYLVHISAISRPYFAGGHPGDGGGRGGLGRLRRCGWRDDGQPRRAA